MCGDEPGKRHTSTQAPTVSLWAPRDGDRHRRDRAVPELGSCVVQRVTATHIGYNTQPGPSRCVWEGTDMFLSSQLYPSVLRNLFCRLSHDKIPSRNDTEQRWVLVHNCRGISVPPSRQEKHGSRSSHTHSGSFFLWPRQKEDRQLGRVIQKQTWLPKACPE